jgi:hypothetical protein
VTFDLARLFRCGPAARNLAVKHCLRRQLVKRPVGQGKARAWLPVYDLCQGCELGAEHQAQAARAGVASTWCGSCGEGLVAGEPCDRCAPRARERGAGASFLWSGAVPSTPIAPPPPERCGLTEAAAAEAAARVREAMQGPTRVATAPAPPPAPRAPANPEPPAEPAQESEMPKGQRSAPWPCCGSQGSRHLKGCAKDGAATIPPPPKPPKGIAPARALRVVTGPLAAKSVPDLVTERAAHVEAIRRIDAEFDRRERELRDARAALGDGKAA